MVCRRLDLIASSRNCLNVISPFYANTGFSRTGSEFQRFGSTTSVVCELNNEKIKTVKPHLSFERMQKRLGALVLDLHVDLVLPDHGLAVEAVDAEEVRALAVVLDETQHARVLLPPFRMPRPFRCKELHYCCRQALEGDRKNKTKFSLTLGI